MPRALGRFGLLASAALALASDALAETVIIYTDNALGAFANEAAQLAGYTTVLYINDATGFRAAVNAGGYDIAVVETDTATVPNDLQGAILDATSLGVDIIFTWPSLATRPALASYLGVTSVATYSAPTTHTTPAGAEWDFLQHTGGVLTGATRDLEPNGHTMGLLFGGWIAAANPAGQATIAVTNGNTTIVNGLTPIDFAETNVDGDALLDVIEMYLEEYAYHLYWPPPPPVGPQITLTGTCPGNMTIDVTNISPGRLLALAIADRPGYSVMTKGSCTGYHLDLEKPVDYIGAFRADNFGNYSGVFPTDAADCGRFVQGFDAYTCDLSSLIRVPLP